MYENRQFVPHHGNLTPAMDREGVNYYDVHAAIAAGRRERAKVASVLFGQAATAIKGWFAAAR